MEKLFSLNNLNIYRITVGEKEYQDMLKLRNEVLRLPLGLNLFDEILEESKDFHFVAYINSELAGCCFLKIIDQSKGLLLLRQMAVRENLRMLGIGKILLSTAELYAKENGYAEIEMEARVNVIGFYEKSGYKQVGKQHDRIGIGIPHVKMIKTIK